MSGSPALAGIELGNDPTRAKTTQPVPEPCGGKVTRHPPTVLAKASGISLRCRVIYLEISGNLRSTLPRILRRPQGSLCGLG